MAQTRVGVKPRPTSNIITDGLVLHLDAGNASSYPGSGITWYDLSGNGNNGVLTNGPTFDSANGGSISFDGVNDYVDCGDNYITKPTGDMSISYWFKGKSSNNNASGIGTNGTSGLRGYLLGTDNSYTNFVSNPKMYFFIPNSASNLVKVSYDLTINTSLWYNIVGVYSPSTYIKIYLNGVEVATNTTSIPSSLYMDNGISLKLGNRGDGSSFKGNISLFSLYHKSLSSSEVLQNYNALKTRFGL